MPRVSVIVPLYNAKRFVAETLRSLLRQTFADFEVLVVDDGSTDDSASVVLSFDDPRITLLRQENAGPAAARNAGLSRATSEYVAFLDADDTWHETKLARHVAHLDADPGLGVSYAVSLLVDVDGASLDAYQRPQLYDVTARDVFCKNPLGHGSNAVLRRAALEHATALGRSSGAPDTAFDESLPRFEDYECWVRLAALGPWRFEGLPDVLAFYRITRTSLSSASLRSTLDSWEEALCRIRRYAPTLTKRDEDRSRAYQCLWLARRAVVLHEPDLARELFWSALDAFPAIVREDPAGSSLTAAAVLSALVLPPYWRHRLQRLAQRVVRR